MIPESRLAEIEAMPSLFRLTHAEKRELLRGYRASLAAPAVPDGWQLVPMKLTDEMKSAAFATDTDRNEWPSRAWKYMLAFAPEPPAAEARQDSGDSIVDAVRSKLAARSLAGQAKYGQKMTRTDLSRADWLRHAQEEALDLAVYLQRLQEMDANIAIENDHALLRLLTGEPTGGAL